MSSPRHCEPLHRSFQPAYPALARCGIWRSRERATSVENQRTTTSVKSFWSSSPKALTSLTLPVSTGTSCARVRAVPGQQGRSLTWGELPLVVDTSAWARAHHPEVRQFWKGALLDRRLRISPVVRFEILLSARNGKGFGMLAERLSALQAAPLSASVIATAENAMRELANRSAGSHRLPIVNYFVAASAQELGAAVIHYDRDYDTLAKLMSFESIWLAPAGTLS